MLNFYARLIEVIGWIVFSVGCILTLVLFIGSGVEGSPFLASLMLLGYGVGVAFGGIGIIAFGQLIKVFMKIEENTRPQKPADSKEQNWRVS